MAGGDDERLEGEPPNTPEHEIVPLAPLSALLADPRPRPSFADYERDARNWITLVTGEYYPDILKDACELYEPALRRFGHLLRESESSARLLMSIADVSPQWMRIQLARIFRKYVSPETPVEMLKKKTRAGVIVEDFGGTFRPIPEVQAAFDSRPLPDEALCALLWEYKDRGKKGYDLTTRFFDLFRRQFPDLTLIGPEKAGRDVRLGSVFPQYPKPDRPVDFLVMEGNMVLAVGLARYDGDRGGAQEDDRVGGYANCADEVRDYCRANHLEKTKILFLNDGPGLMLGSMWRDYALIEQRWPGRILVFTLRMLPERVTMTWLRS